MSDDAVFEILNGSILELRGGALIFSTKGEKNWKRSAVATRISPNFPLSTIVTKAALEMWNKSPSPTMQDFRLDSELDLLKMVGSDEDLVYAGDTFDESLSRECVKRATKDYVQCLEMQVIDTIGLGGYISFENLPPKNFTGVVLYNFILPVKDALKAKNEKKLRKIRRDFYSLMDGYPHPNQIREMYTALKKGKEDLALNIMYQMMTIKSEEYEMTALLKKEHDKMRYQSQKKRK